MPAPTMVTARDMVSRREFSCQLTEKSVLEIKWREFDDGDVDKLYNVVAKNVERHH